MPELTPVAEDYVKAIWSATEWGGDPATVTSLARRFQTAAATVSATLGRLSRQGLVEHEPYGAVALTEAGEAAALAMVRRHRLIETLLVERLGYDWEQVHDEAERLEHAVSELFVERIDALLGRPAADPHGDPIPDARGRIRYPADAAPLPALLVALGGADAGAAAPGDTGRGPGAAACAVEVVRVADDDPALLARLGRLGVRPGAELELRAGEVLVEGRRVDVDSAETAAIIVRPRAQ